MISDELFPGVEYPTYDDAPSVPTIRLTGVLTMTDSERIVQLEARVAQLEARLAQLESRMQPALLPYKIDDCCHIKPYEVTDNNKSYVVGLQWAPKGE